MVLTPSTMQELGIKAPDFTLPDPAGKHYSLADCSISKGLLVIFMCNHCPYVHSYSSETGGENSGVSGAGNYGRGHQQQRFQCSSR